MIITGIEGRGSCKMGREKERGKSESIGSPVHKSTNAGACKVKGRFDASKVGTGL